MNLLFITLSRIEDINARGIYTDLMREFIRKGVTPYIVIPGERRYGKPEEVFESFGARILRVKTLNIQKSNFIEKGISTLLLESQYMAAIKRHWKGVRFDLCMYSTPPITFNKIIAWQKKQGVPTYLLLKDIFPQNAVDLGLFSKKSPIYWFFRWKEKKLYTLSDRIGCMSPANVRFVLEHNPNLKSKKIEICPNSIELRKEVSIKDKLILTKYGIPTSKLLFIYGGNLGKPQGIDFLIQLLNELKDREDLHVCVVGSGTEGKKLHNWYERVNPKSVTLMNAMPKNDYDKLVSAADIGMVFLDRRFTIPNFPSRILSYLENRQPVFLATDKNTDMGKIAMRNGFGVWCESGDINTAIENINSLVNSRSMRINLGEAGYQFLVNNYTVDKSVNVILRGLSCTKISSND